MEIYEQEIIEEEDKSTVEEGGLDTSEEAFMKGYDNEEKIKECPECGASIEQDEEIIAKIDGENLVFCSKSCAEDYKEGLAED
jgi:YHS domain-containing protein